MRGGDCVGESKIPGDGSKASDGYWDIEFEIDPDWENSLNEEDIESGRFLEDELFEFILNS